MLNSKIDNVVLNPAVQSQIYSRIYREISTLSAEVMVTDEPVKFKDRLNYEYHAIKPGEKWGKLWDCAWFHFTGEADLQYKPEELALLIDLDGEGCVFSSQGVPLRGLTTVKSVFDRSLGLPGKIEVPFTEIIEDHSVDIWVEAGCNDLFGNYCNGVLTEAKIVVVNENMRQLYYDYFTLANLASCLDKGDPHYYSIVYALEEAYLALGTDFTDEQVCRAREILRPELERKNAENPLLKYYAVGHAHMDLAWLWPIRETKRKIGRTFSTVVANMEKYPDYKFGISQPQQLQWLKEEYPELYGKVKEKIMQKRIEPQGAMWVEADTNISGGEALVRQLFYGKKFFHEEFGYDIRELWLPDVFGYSGALPQILKKAGVDYFLTIKLSWNEHNVFPHHTFIWEGIDGSQILAHMPPEGTYNSYGAPESVIRATRVYQERGRVDSAMLLFGIGDGGGGPGMDHLERMKRMENLLGVAPVKQAFAKEFFADLEHQRKKLYKHRGELYLEKHQGTYTSQAHNKKFNRLAEYALMDTEFISVLAGIAAEEYPKEKLESIWKEVLLYQFHDILPGSSIQRVYNESEARYAELLEEIDGVKSGFMDSLEKGGPAVLNTTSFARTELVLAEDGIYEVTARPYGITKLEKKITEFDVSFNENTLENAKLKISFNEDGSIHSVYDKTACRETVYDGANRLVIFADMADAWDMAADYRLGETEELTLQSCETVLEPGAVVRTHVYTYQNSTLTQRVILRHNSGIVEFDTQADWQETHKMLRAEFDMAVFSNQVSCDIQFGYIQRSTNCNNSIEYAQQEICAHKWIDLSDSNYGVALLNDCKYGYYAKGNRISVNLLRSQMYPCENQDKGHHHFRYALYPHAGTLADSDVSAQAYAFNRPLVLCGLQETESLFCTDNSKVVIECIKKADDGRGVIVRVYNNSDGFERGELKTSLDYSRVTSADLMENELGDVSLSLQLHPFEIVTLRFE